MIVKVPIRLVSEANSSEHWTKKNKRHKIQKFLTRSYLGTHLMPELPVHVKLTRWSPRLFDKDDNLPTAFKYIKDEIADVFCGETYSKTGRRVHGRNDASEYITWEYCQEKTTAKEHYITVEIESKKQPTTTPI